MRGAKSLLPSCLILGPRLRGGTVADPVWQKLFSREGGSPGLQAASCVTRGLAAQRRTIAASSRDQPPPIAWYSVT